MDGSATRDPDRLLPVDPATREIARALYERVARSPIISPHGHVSATTLAQDRPFENLAELMVTHDHYVTRLLHADGVDLGQLGVGGSSADPRLVWRRVAERWPLFAGTATGYWIEEELSGVLGIDLEPSADSADEIYDRVAERLGTDEFRPRALFRRFGVEVLATTDDPLDDLASHDALATSDLGGRVVPTFRPDRYLDPDGADFPDLVERLLEATFQPRTFAGYLAALEARRRYFIDHGAVSVDHGVVEPVARDLDPLEAETLFRAAVTGRATPEQSRAFREHMLWQMARMSVADGLVMTVHAGVLRDHHRPTFERYGSDTGGDIPVPTSFTRGLRPLLESFGVAPGFHLILFTVDESTYSRELAPLAGFYPSVYIGVPWWFLDAPEAMRRFRAATFETAGFYRGSGFVDDTRAFLSIPARHDVARRTDAGVLARLVREGRVTRARAERITDDLVDAIPRAAFKL